MLDHQASQWPTPRSEDSESAGNHPGATDSLTGATGMWPTPQSHDERERGNTMADNHHYPHDLSNAASLWPTPDAPGQGGPRNRQESRGQGHNVSLGESAEHWQTPASDSFRSRGGERKDEMGLDQQSRRFPLDPETGTHGSESSQSAPTSRRQLNPKFVCWLMGWPPGWTSLEPLSSASLGTASSPPRPHSPSAPSPDNWPTQNARTGSMQAEGVEEWEMSS